jgi:hypothetical protein
LIGQFIHSARCKPFPAKVPFHNASSLESYFGHSDNDDTALNYLSEKRSWTDIFEIGSQIANSTYHWKPHCSYSITMLHSTIVTNKEDHDDSKGRKNKTKNKRTIDEKLMEVDQVDGESKATAVTTEADSPWAVFPFEYPDMKDHSI